MCLRAKTRTGWFCILVARVFTVIFPAVRICIRVCCPCMHPCMLPVYAARVCCPCMHLFILSNIYLITPRLSSVERIYPTVKRILLFVNLWWYRSKNFLYGLELFFLIIGSSSVYCGQFEWRYINPPTVWLRCKTKHIHTDPYSHRQRDASAIRVSILVLPDMVLNNKLGYLKGCEISNFTQRVGRKKEPFVATLMRPLTSVSFIF